MRRWATVYCAIVLLLAASWTCFAQLAQTNAGHGAVSSSVCTGTSFHMTNPNNPSISPWSTSNMTGVTGQLDPTGGTGATKLVSASGSGAFGVNTNQGVGTLSSGTTYAATAYFAPVVAPNNVILELGDGVSNAIGSLFDVSALTTGGSLAGGAGTNTCVNIQSAANGYAFVSFAGNMSSTITGVALYIFLCDSNSSCNNTNLQAIDAWQVSP